MLKQPWVMFSNYSTKPEFALGNWQIAWGKAIIRCTRTTGTFAGEEILACFESTATESISTSGNKKIYIEIPEVYVNDSTAITDTLTGWANLWVWRIVSSSDYPTHSNYIKLWEVSGWDWQNATDLRPEVLRRGKPNTISYFWGNGEEERIDIDNNSLNKYLMSNWAGVAPSWEEWGWSWGGGWENFKRTFTADEDLLAKSMFWVEVQAGTTDVDSSLDFWTTTATKVFFPVVLNWEDFSTIKLNLAAVNSPADTLSVRVETLDNNWIPTGTLVDVWAYGTASPTSSASDITVNLSGTVEWLTAHTKAAIVLSRSGSASNSNYYRLWCVWESKVISQIYTYNGSTYSSVNYSGCIDCDWFATEATVQATSLNWVEPVWYCETGAVAWNDFTGILEWTVDYEWAEAWKKYYLSNTWTLASSWNKEVWVWIQSWVLSIFWYENGWSSNSSQITATAAINMNKGTVVLMKQNDWKVRPTWGQRWFSSTELDLWEVTPDAASQSYIWLKTVQITATQSLNVFSSGTWYITLCVSNADLDNNEPIVTEFRTAWAFDVCVPKEWYAAIIYRDKSTQYPSLFMVSVSGSTTSVSSSATVLENYAVKWNISVWVTRLQDADSTSFCALRVRNYNESSSETLDWKTRYCLCSFSGVTITTGTLDLFEWDRNVGAHTAFWYLWGWLVWMLFCTWWDSTYKYSLWWRTYDNWSFWSGDFVDLEVKNSSSFMITWPQLLWLWWQKCLVSMWDMCYICSTFPTIELMYSYNKVWNWGQQIRHYTVDWWKHLMKIDLTRNADNTYWKMVLTKYKVWDASVVELKKRTFTLTNVNTSYSMPQINEIWSDNTSLTNDADWDYYIYYLTSSWIAAWESGAKGWMALWVVKNDVQTGQLANVIVSGTAPWTFTWPWKQVYINWNVAWETESDYPIWISISTTQFIFNK